MSVPNSNAKATVVTVCVLLLVGYLFYTSFQFGAADPSGRLRLVRLSSGVVGLGLLFAMSKLRWRPLVQFALAGGLSIALPMAYALVWEQTPAMWIWLAALFNNVFTFLIAWALWHFVIRRWLVAVACIMLGVVVLLVPAVRSTVALIVLAIITIPAAPIGRERRVQVTHAG